VKSLNPTFMLMSFPARKKLHVLQLAAVIFLTVSGGPYGLEELIGQAGKNASLLLLMITPLLWDIPTIFVVLELNSLMPVTGGYYQWVKRAMGLRWAFYEGWWTWLYTFADLAIYPVLFVVYLSFFFPGIEAYKIPVCLAVIWISAGINILGIVPVGKTSIVLSVAVFIPFLILFGLSLVNHHGHFGLPVLSLNQKPFSAIGLGLYTVMWNFIGWDNVTTYAEEVNKPVRSYFISVFTAFILVFGIYFIAVVIALNENIDPAVLSEEGFPALGKLIGGYGLGAIIALGGMASAMGLFSAVLLSVSRIPKVMADDKLLPSKLHLLHPKFKSPYISIICCAVVVSFMVVWTFGELLIIDITLYGAALFLEYIALIKLRRSAANDTRLFRIPLKIPGLIVMTALPLSIYFIALSSAFINSGKTLKPLLFAIIVLLSAELVWQIVWWWNGRMKVTWPL
jgi:amino acid transporter